MRPAVALPASSATARMACEPTETQDRPARRGRWPRGTRRLRRRGFSQSVRDARREERRQIAPASPSPLWGGAKGGGREVVRRRSRKHARPSDLRASPLDPPPHPAPKGEGLRCVCGDDIVSAVSAQRCAIARASCARGMRSRRRASRRCVKSVSSPPRPRSPIRTAISAARRCGAFGSSVDHHAVGEPRRKRQPAQFPPFLGDAAVCVDGAEFNEQRPRLGKGQVRRRIEEGKLFGRCTPCREVERKTGKVGGEDFGAGIGFERRGLRLPSR